MCRPLTRRELLRYAGLVAATPLVVRYQRPVRAFAAAASRAVPMNLELVTLTETSAILTWFTGDPTSLDQYHRPAPLPADTVLELGTTPANLRTVVSRDDETPYHHVEVTGLEPGRTYFYTAMSNGLVATPTQAGPEPPATGVFTTPQPPAGAHLFTFAVANDFHMGEMVSGIALDGLPPGFPVDPAHPYWLFTAQDAVAEARRRGAELLLVNGDLSSEAQPVYLDEAKTTLDAFGPYRQDYWITRGNHDRPHRGATYAHCEPSTYPGYEDCLLDAFFPDGRTYFSFDRNGVHFVGLDTADLTNGSTNGAMTADQFAWLEADLAAHAGTPTFVMGHHPVTEEATVTAVPPVVFTLDQQDAVRLEQLSAQHGVVGVFNGHTHRNKRTQSVFAPNTPFMEIAAVKEYPSGFALVRVHEGGYAVNFYKTEGDPSRAWSERSRGEYLGLYPYYTLGTLADRNFVVNADFTGLRPGEHGAPSGSSVPPAGGATNRRGAGGELPATGATTGLAAAGAALTAAGLAAKRTART